MRNLLAIGLVAGLFSFGTGVSTASAQFWGSSYVGAGGLGGFYYPFYISERVPYFAAHPPVYYSTPIARSYGHSPFPYPATLWSVPRVRTLTVANSHVVSVPRVLASVESPAVQPVLVANPFVK